MSDDDEERLVANVNKDLKRRAKADPRSIKDIVESSLEREFSTGATAAVERRIDEKEARITNLTREINDRERDRAEEQDALERLKEQLEAYQGEESEQESRLEDAREALKRTPRDPDNPAIESWAKKLQMTPQELLNEL